MRKSWKLQEALKENGMRIFQAEISELWIEKWSPFYQTVQKRKSFIWYFIFCHNFFLLMEITFTTLNVVKLKAYYTCVREMEHSHMEVKKLPFFHICKFLVLSSVSSLDLLIWTFFQTTNLQTRVFCWSVDMWKVRPLFVNSGTLLRLHPCAEFYVDIPKRGTTRRCQQISS